MGVFRNLRRALSIYGSGADGDGEGGETPVANQQELVERLQEVAAEVREFMEDRGIDVARLVESTGLERIHYLDTAVRAIAPGDGELTDDAVEALLGTEESKKAFLSQAQLLGRLHKAVLPDPRASEFSGLVGTVATLVDKIRSLSTPVDISPVMDRVEALLDESVVADGACLSAPERIERRIRADHASASLDVSIPRPAARRYCRATPWTPVERARKSASNPNPQGGTTMRFMMLVKASEESEAGVLPSEEEFAAMGKYNEEMVKAGVMLAAEGLRPTSEGVRVDFSGEKPAVIDGPFTEAKELIAGFWLIQVKSLEEAIEWARRAPFEEGEIEIRRVFEADESGDAVADDLPKELAKPARRALTGAGYVRLAQLARVSEAEILALHGMGPRALDQLRRALAANGLSFADS